METSIIRRILSDMNKSEDIFRLQPHLIVPMDIPQEFAEDYCEEYYPFHLFRDGEAQLRYYKDLKQVMKMELIVKPTIFSKELANLKTFSLEFDSSTNDFNKLAKALDKVLESYKFNDGFLDIEEVRVAYPLFYDFVEYDNAVKKSIIKFLEDSTHKPTASSDFDEYGTNVEMSFISLYRTFIYGMYTLPIDRKTRTKLEKIISKHQKEEKNNE